MQCGTLPLVLVLYPRRDDLDRLRQVQDPGQVRLLSSRLILLRRGDLSSALRYVSKYEGQSMSGEMALDITGEKALEGTILCWGINLAQSFSCVGPPSRALSIGCIVCSLIDISVRVPHI